jgi:hypothetical protein
MKIDCLMGTYGRYSLACFLQQSVPAQATLQRMHELADPAAELIHWWDDDDLYLRWHLEDCLRHVEEHVAWKPESCWLFERDVTFSRHVNAFEGS